MIWFFTPYSFKKKLFEAYDGYMQLITDENDWGCLMDGDMAFLQSDFGNELQEYIDKYPGTGLFICYSSRNPYGHQMKPGLNPESDSIKYIYSNTVKMRTDDHLKVVKQTKRVAGPLLLIKKATWTKYRAEIEKMTENANIQAIDSAISDVLSKHGETTLLMAGVQVYHYFRQYSFTEKHILSDKLTVVIRTHNRPGYFKRCIESVRAQTHKNIDIVVGVDNDESLQYVEPYNPTKIVMCQNRQRSGHDDFPANGYISNLVEGITDGYILILDDDNFIGDTTGVEQLFKQIDREWCIYIIRYRYPDGRLFPNDRQFAAKVVENGGIDWASCVFHARFKNVSKSRPVYNGDFYWINELVKYVKTTKWINLPLVHTDTPGADGKPETEMKKPPVAHTAPVLKPVYVPPPKIEGRPDVVYVLGTGSRWANNEIRFSLRSLEKNLQNFGRVFIVGECPAFLQNVVHIPAADIFNPAVNADGNIINKVLAACADERVSDNFLFINDDHLVIKPIAAPDVPPLHKGDMRTYPTDFWMLNFWRKRLKRTMNELKRQGLTTFNFDCHTPIVFNKQRFQEVMQNFDWHTDIGYTMKSLYGNMVYADNGELLTDQKKAFFRAYTLKEINSLVEAPSFMAFNDEGLNPSMKWWLMDNFSTRSRFESDEPSDKVFDLWRWMDNGRQWDEGVKVFKTYWRNPHLQEMFDCGETPVLRKKMEFKLMQTINNL